MPGNLNIARKTVVFKFLFQYNYNSCVKILILKLKYTIFSVLFTICKCHTIPLFKGWKPAFDSCT